MSEHTKGRLHFDKSLTLRSKHDDAIAEVEVNYRTGWTPTPKQSEANARRLVACWNYCEARGISTANLEDDITSFSKSKFSEHMDKARVILAKYAPKVKA